MRRSIRGETQPIAKKHYRSASIVSCGRVVFNIKGNDYRLVTEFVDYGTDGLESTDGTAGKFEKLNATRTNPTAPSDPRPRRLRPSSAGQNRAAILRFTSSHCNELQVHF